MHSMRQLPATVRPPRAPRDDMIRLHVPQIEAFPADSTATLLRLVRGKPVGLGERADGKQTLI